MMRILVYTIFVLFTLGCSQNLEKDHPLYSEAKNIKTDKHKRIKGTRLFAVVPDSFIYEQKSKRFSTENTDIKIVEFPNVSWSNIKAKNGLQSIPLYGYEGYYFESEDIKAKNINILVQFGDDDFVFHINAKTSTELENGRTELLKILQSIYYDDKFVLDELELANFTVDKTFTNYNLVTGQNDVYLFSNAQNSILFQSLSIEISEENLDEQINNILNQELKAGVRFEEREIENDKIGDYSLRILRSKIKFQEKSGMYCLALIDDSKNAIAITAKGYDNIEDMISQFNGIIKTIRFKND